jgi:hypothetical protein
LGSVALGESTVDGKNVVGWVKAGTSAKDNTYFSTADSKELPVQVFGLMA